MSNSTVLLYRDTVLKISAADEESRREASVMRWLNGKLPVPDVLHCEEYDGMLYLVMSRVRGKTLIPDFTDEREPLRVAELLVDAINMLQDVDISGFGFDSRLDLKLREARKNVNEGLVDVEKVEAETFGSGGFASPLHLLEWLERNRPDEILSFTHGDLCLPNVFADGYGICGFIDLGHAGIADAYCDIALAHRSLRHNFDGSYGTFVPKFNPDVLFEMLGITPDREKLRYYLLLDELF